MQPTPSHGKTVYRVSPVDGAWLIELAGDSVHEIAQHKGEALARAKELARRAPIGVVVVVGADGRVEQEIEVDASSSRS